MPSSSVAGVRAIVSFSASGSREIASNVSAIEVKPLGEHVGLRRDDPRGVAGLADEPRELGVRVGTASA